MPDGEAVPVEMGAAASLCLKMELCRLTEPKPWMLLPGRALAVPSWVPLEYHELMYLGLSMPDGLPKYVNMEI